MAIVDLVMPKLGESIMEATILRWHKKEGDFINLDETLLEIATDKVDSEVPSSAEGVIEALLYKENDVVPIGAVIAKIKTNTEEVVVPEPVQPQSEIAPAATQPEAIPYQPTDIKAPKTGGARFFSPLVLNIAANEGVSLAELQDIPGKGNEGRVTKKDILQWVENRKSPQPVQATPSTAEVSQTISTAAPVVESKEEAVSANEPAATTSYGDNIEVVEMDRMRKVIAKHMIDSQNTSAHVTSFAECDVTNIVLWRDRVKNAFQQQEGEKITFTPIFMEAVVKCLKKYPWLNSSVDGDKILVRKDINIGMATALPNGNLIVPVIRDADYLNMTGLAKSINKLADAARNNKLRPDDTQGATFTVTNIGSFGSLMGTPLINQPQVAILAIGAIKKRPVVVETEQGDNIAVRHMMYLSLSYDHRIIDGALGSTFLSAIAKELEAFDSNRSF